MAVRDTFDTIRRPEYTGQNRCTPCTIVNLSIALVAAAAVAVASQLLGVLAFGAFVGVIYLRGYLVPGTPALTKQYLPDPVLAWFDKEPVPDVTLGEGVDEEGDLDPETTLVAAGALEPCEESADLRLTLAFAERLHEHAERLSVDEKPRLALATLLGVDERRVAFAAHGRSLVAEVDGEQVGQWPSRAALVADVAANQVLQEQTRDWTDLPVERRSALLGSLRVFVEQCPECDGPVRFQEETKESCCRSWQVLVSECENCGDRLFEMQASEVEAAEE